jgi:SAM-dependent methyltransferase
VSYTVYDDFAWFYNRYFGDRFLGVHERVLRDLFATRVKRERSVLDLACGTGQISQWLSREGYKVTGIDGSRQMLEHAQKNAPDATFLARDIRDFKIINMFHAALCTFDSINHVMSLQELTNVFNNVYGALRGGGLFVFDVNTDDGFKARWNGTSSIIAKDHVLASESSYDPKRREGKYVFAAFPRQKRRWQRVDVVIQEKAYSQVEIERRLAKSLFKSIRAYDAQRDFKLKEVGRLFFVCEK